VKQCASKETLKTKSDMLEQLQAKFADSMMAAIRLAAPALIMRPQDTAWR
jgi:hypothetical protein